MLLIHTSKNVYFSCIYSSTYVHFRISLIQQRVRSFLAHLNCRIYTCIPSLNQKSEIIASFTNNSIYIELIHNEGFYIVNQLSTFLEFAF